MSNFPDAIALTHISDLHFGGVLANNVFSFRSKALHYPSHDFVLCLDFPNALEYIRTDLLDLADEEIINTVVSGDVSAMGLETDFAVAHAMLRSRPRIKRGGLGQYAGFSVPDDRMAAVPGNHDHWNGLPFLRRPRAYTPSVFPKHFRRTPWVKEWRSASGNLVLEIYGIDSNSGLEPKRTNLRARGSFSASELQGLVKDLETSENRPVEPDVVRVRALVTHHSLMYAGGLFGAVELDDAARSALLTIATKYKIAVIMTGHTHDSGFHPHSVTDPTNIIDRVWEIRSATTFQGPAKPSHQGFWCGLVWLSDDGPRWYGWRFHWAGSRFELRGNSDLKPDVNILLPAV